MKDFSLKKRVAQALVFLALNLANGSDDPSAFAGQECKPLDEQPVKLEAWLSKKYEPNLTYLRKEFAAMGDTKVMLWVYPAENPSGVVAIGRCVPAFIGRYALQKARTYTKGILSLVHQGFVHNHWIGIGTSLFSENSQQPVTETQVRQLLDENLSTAEFQDLYRKFTIQDKNVKGFGMSVPNPKLMSPPQNSQPWNSSK